MRLSTTFLHSAALLFVLLFSAANSTASTILTGTFDSDGDISEFVLFVTTPGTLTAQSLGYGGSASSSIPAGGFATSLSLYDGNAGPNFGSQLATDFVGGTAVGAGCSNAAQQDSTTHFCEDAQISIPVSVGTYYLTLSEQGNDGPGALPTFPVIKPGDFPLNPGSNFSPGPFGDPGAPAGTFTRNGDWALLAAFTGSIQAIPEPAPLFPSALILVVLALAAARRNRTTTSFTKEA